MLQASRVVGFLLMPPCLHLMADYSVTPLPPTPGELISRGGTDIPTFKSPALGGSKTTSSEAPSASNTSTASSAKTVTEVYNNVDLASAFMGKFFTPLMLSNA